MKTYREILDTMRRTLATNWIRRDGRVVPEAEDVRLGNDAVDLEAAVLFADLKGSSKLVKEYKSSFAAEVYKAFLVASSEVIKNNDGVITAFDGDRIMAVFIGPSKCTNAARTALQIHAIVRGLNSLIREVYPSVKYEVGFGVGVDVSNLFVIRTGVRGSNDLAWIGDASNCAAKLSEIRERSANVYITRRCYERINDSVKISSPASGSICMWNATGLNLLGQDIFESTWYWTPA